MIINNELIVKWIRNVAAVKGLQMDPEALADDVFLMAYVYKDPVAFEIAMRNVIYAINLLVNDKVDCDNSGWGSYHFQSKRTRGQKADLRIIFQSGSDSIRVRGFGNRWIQADIYDRLRLRKS